MEGVNIQIKKKGTKNDDRRTMSRGRLVHDQERKKKIRESEYNARYQKIIVESLPKNLERESKTKI